jgi:predicted short-subunit dehydrogenase-like oxidoreductase (DUF2520 family)
MRRTIDNGFELTGPIQRGDWETVDRHLDAIRQTRPELEELYRVLADCTETIAEGDGATPSKRLLRPFRGAR